MIHKRKVDFISKMYESTTVSLTLYLLLLALLASISGVRGVLDSQTISWSPLIATDGVKFTGRNAFAACVFKGKIWVTGGRSELYSMYNLLDSTKEADVWVSEHGDLWRQISTLQGDYFQQNADVIQPGPIAPWYHRFGHTLTPIDVTGDGINDFMILMGGFSSSPSNDMWVTADGETWVYSGLAGWSPRGFHGASVMGGKLYVVGGTPLNNEVWVMDPKYDFAKVNRTTPMTRAMYMSYTYDIKWTNLLMDSPFAPRVGMALWPHWWFNETNACQRPVLGWVPPPNCTTYEDAELRLLMIGGYGGWRETDPRYDGLHTYADVWATKNGTVWECLNSNASFGERSFMGISGLHYPGEPRRDYVKASENISSRVYIFGGGSIGFFSGDSKIVNKMNGKLDAWYTRNGIDWFQISYEEGGGKTVVPLYSTQEWTAAIVDTKAVSVGVWGHAVVPFNTSDGNSYPDRLIFIAGDRTLGGSFSNTVFESKKGLFCDILGVPCGGPTAGSCGLPDLVVGLTTVVQSSADDNSGCICIPPSFGEHCNYVVTVVSTAFILKIKYALFSICTLLVIVFQLYF